MKLATILRAAMLGALLMQGAAFGNDQSIKVYNRLRLMYDDNIYERDTDTTESWLIAEEPEFLVDLNLSRTFIGLRYRPSFVWWDNRETDDTDLHHDFDADVTHNFTPRLSLALKDNFRVAQQAEQIDRGTTIREQEDYMYNVVDGVASYLLQPNTRLEGAARYTILRYDEETVAEQDDYDIISAGASLRQQLSASLALSGDYRYEDTAYTDADNRDAQGHFLGLGAEKIFSPELSGNLRGGYQIKMFDAEGVDDRSSPYADASLTFAFTPATRLSAGAGYAMTEANVYPYVNQTRLSSFASLAHDFTARLSAYASASYVTGDYDEEETLVPGDFPGGSEDYAQFSARASYKIGRRNWIEAGWHYMDLSSDLREEFDRNRFDIGWRTEI